MKRYRADPQKVVAATRAWRTANPQRVRVAKKAWKKRNPGKVSADSRRATLAKQQATPAWLKPAHWAEIDGFYLWTRIFPGHHVDHVVALRCTDRTRARHRIACGLNIPANLAPLTDAENYAKNSFLIPGTERAEAPEFGTRWDILNPVAWWDREWAAMGFD